MKMTMEVCEAIALLFSPKTQPPTFVPASFPVVVELKVPDGFYPTPGAVKWTKKTVWHPQYGDVSAGNIIKTGIYIPTANQTETK